MFRLWCCTNQTITPVICLDNSKEIEDTWLFIYSNLWIYLSLRMDCMNIWVLMKWLFLAFLEKRTTLYYSGSFGWIGSKLNWFRIWWAGVWGTAQLLVQQAGWWLRGIIVPDCAPWTSCDPKSGQWASFSFEIFLWYWKVTYLYF